MQMDFGTVLVSNAAVKEKLLATQRDLVVRLLKMLQAVPREAMVAVARRYKELQAQLLQKPECLEDVDRQRRLIEDLPAKIQELTAEAETVQPWYGIPCGLEVLWERLSYTDKMLHCYHRRYDTIHQKGICLPDDAIKDRTAGEGGHIKLWGVVERVQADLDAAEAGYKEEMADEQENFAESLSQLSSHVDKLASYTDIDKVRQPFHGLY